MLLNCDWLLRVKQLLVAILVRSEELLTSEHVVDSRRLLWYPAVCVCVCVTETGETMKAVIDVLQEI